MARDLLAALWPASYRGVPFYIRHDSARGGRRLVVHEFPNRDDPFVEDLGEKALTWAAEIYLVGDSYDASAAAVEIALCAAGVGTLVLPVQGPVQARIEEFERSRELDRTGYIGFHATFVRDSGAPALETVQSLAQAAYDAASAVAPQAAAMPLAIAGEPSFVVADAVARLQDGVATLDAIRAGGALDAVASSALATSLATFYTALPAALDPVAGVAPTTLPTLVGLAIVVADALPADTAVGAFAAAFDDLLDEPTPDPSRAASTQTMIANAQAATDATRLAFFAGYVEALVAATYTSRQAGIAARADCVDRGDVVLAALGGAGQRATFLAVLALRDAAVSYLSDLVATLAPVIDVRLARVLPSTVACYDLYGDLTNLGDLRARNALAHPSFLPKRFEALAPSAASRLPV